MTRSGVIFPPLGDPKLTQKSRVSRPISWDSKKLKRVTKSPLASEASILTDAADAAFLVGKMFQEVFRLKEMPEITSLTDSKSLSDHLNTTKVSDDGRLRVDVAYIREMVKLKELKVNWVDKSQQLADCLTKAGASSASLLEVLRMVLFGEARECSWVWKLLVLFDVCTAVSVNVCGRVAAV